MQWSFGLVRLITQYINGSSYNIKMISFAIVTCGPFY